MPTRETAPLFGGEWFSRSREVPCSQGNFPSSLLRCKQIHWPPRGFRQPGTELFLRKGMRTHQNLQELLRFPLAIGFLVKVGMAYRPRVFLCPWATCGNSYPVDPRQATTVGNPAPVVGWQAGKWNHWERVRWCVGFFHQDPTSIGESFTNPNLLPVLPVGTIGKQGKLARKPGGPKYNGYTYL